MSSRSLLDGQGGQVRRHCDPICEIVETLSKGMRSWFCCVYSRPFILGGLSCLAERPPPHTCTDMHTHTRMTCSLVARGFRGISGSNTGRAGSQIIVRMTFLGYMVRTLRRKASDHWGTQLSTKTRATLPFLLLKFDFVCLQNCRERGRSREKDK